jgi:hypothetical protein
MTTTSWKNTWNNKSLKNSRMLGLPMKSLFISANNFYNFIFRGAESHCVIRRETQVQVRH